MLHLHLGSFGFVLLLLLVPATVSKLSMFWRKAYRGLQPNHHHPLPLGPGL